ncbi:hypothetical protein [Cellulomonas sp. ICMP 17802]|uniref:hypothetical protein n=1 Tax=Cellulomonas sp. ICMP 17802 TaxID=3239199 RepID=UPI00351B91DA
MTGEPDRPDLPDGRVSVVWALVGEGGHVVRRTSHWWEVAVAARQHRPPRALYHAALELVVDDEVVVLEMTPRWGRAAAGAREVVATGPVGARWLGRSRLFRYEVRFTRPGTPADPGATVVGRGPEAVAAVLAAAPGVPRLTWGRQVRSARDMWTSNSVVSWVLADVGLLGDLGPPGSGLAPGWDAGVAVRAGG